MLKKITKGLKDIEEKQLQKESVKDVNLKAEVKLLSSENKELKKQLKGIHILHKQKVQEAIDSRITDERYFKIPEVRKWYKPTSWVRPDKTNPMVMIIFSPAGDLVIRERVVDLRGNLNTGKKTSYRTEPTESWDIAHSDVTGFRGKRIHFYFQDVPNPLSIRRKDEEMEIKVNTETYTKSQKSNLITQLLTEEMSFRDYLTLILIGVNFVVTVLIAVKVWLLKGGA